MAEKNGATLACQRGMALLLVVAMVSVLSAVVIRFNRTTRASMDQVQHYTSDTILSAMAESGVEVGLTVLDSDRLQNDFDALIEPWALLGDQNLGPLFDRGELRVAIDDFSGRLPINSLVAGGEQNDPARRRGSNVTSTSSSETPSGRRQTGSRWRGWKRSVSTPRSQRRRPSVISWLRSTAAIERLIHRLSEELEVTSLLVTHDIEGGLEMGDRVAMLEGGLLRFLGTPTEFKNCTDPVVRAFVDRQAAEAALDMMSGTP